MIRMYKTLNQSERKVADIYGIELDYMEWALHIKPQLPGFITDRQENGKLVKDKSGEKEIDFAMCLAEKMSE